MKTQTVQTTCDLCCYGGPFTNERNFVRVGDYDLCKWCADDRTSAWIESGGHRVTFTDDRRSWSCTCGRTYDRSLLVLRAAAPGVRAVVPSLPRALANLHINYPPAAGS